MKRSHFIASLVLLICLLAALAIAGQVFDRATATLGTATGTCTWTNTEPYAALELKRVWIQNALAPTTVTVSRVSTISSVSYTDTVGTVSVTGTAASTASLTASYLANGDRLAFAAVTATGATAVIEYEVQKH